MLVNYTTCKANSLCLVNGWLFCSISRSSQEDTCEKERSRSKVNKISQWTRKSSNFGSFVSNERMRWLPLMLCVHSISHYLRSQYILVHHDGAHSRKFLYDSQLGLMKSSRLKNTGGENGENIVLNVGDGGLCSRL